MKKTLSIILSLALVWALAIVPASAAPAFAAPTAAVNYATLTPNEKLVYDYITSTGNWPEWVSCYTPSLQASNASFALNATNQANGTGILDVTSAQVEQIVQVPNSTAPKYPELARFYQSESTYQCYLVTCNMTVKSDSKYFHNGLNNQLVILVNDGGTWGVGNSCGYTQNVNDLFNRVGWGFIGVDDIYSYPATVCVGMAHRGSDGKPVFDHTVGDIDFTDFIENTVSGEVGVYNYEPEALKAISLAEKMYAWWCVLAHYRDKNGVDIYGGYDVAYSDTRTDYQTAVTDAVADVQNGYIVAEDTNSKGQDQIFGTNCNSKYVEHPEGSGVLNQDGANEKALAGDSCEDILHFYFDNSAFNNPNVGTVRISLY